MYSFKNALTAAIADAAAAQAEAEAEEGSQDKP